jgi:hypothetical protein
VNINAIKGWVRLHPEILESDSSLAALAMIEKGRADNIIRFEEFDAKPDKIYKNKYNTKIRKAPMAYDYRDEPGKPAAMSNFQGRFYFSIDFYRLFQFFTKR